MYQGSFNDHSLLQKGCACINIFIYIHMPSCVHMKRVYACVYACTYVCMYVRTYVGVYMCVCMYVSTHVCMHVCLYVCMYITIHVSSWLSGYAFIYLRISSCSRLPLFSSVDQLRHTVIYLFIWVHIYVSLVIHEVIHSFYCVPHEVFM